MTIYKRAQLSTLLTRLREEPHRLIVVTGPRQTGKTTLVQQALEQIELPSAYLAVDKPDPTTLPTTLNLTGDHIEFAARSPVPLGMSRDMDWLVRQWEKARVEAQDSKTAFVMAIDEIQKIPNWSETVKGLWDADRLKNLPLHVILLSSAPLLMQQGMTESLAGRYETVRLMHWSFTEMAAAFGFDLEQYIYFGGYPGSIPYVSEPDRWHSYIAESLIEPNIEKDILAMQRVDKPRTSQTTVPTRCCIFRPNSFLHQNDGATPRCRQYDNPCTLYRPIDICRHAHRSSEIQ